jgi:hypothetical protein
MIKDLHRYKKTPDMFFLRFNIGTVMYVMSIIYILDV